MGSSSHAPAFGTEVSGWQVNFLAPGSPFSSGEVAWPKPRVFPGGNRRLLLPGRSLRGVERPACKPRGASGIVALVEFAPCGARRPGVPHSLDVAFASPHRLAATCQPMQKEAEVAALRCVAASIVVVPSAILTESRTRPSDWGSNARFGPVEERRNNRRLATFTCALCVLQIWWLSPFHLRMP